MKTTTQINVVSAIEEGVAADSTFASNTDVSKKAISCMPYRADVSCVYDYTIPCTTKSWVASLPSDVTRSFWYVFLCVAAGAGPYFVHLEYFSENMSIAIWCGQFWLSFAHLYCVGYFWFFIPSRDHLCPDVLSCTTAFVVSLAARFLLNFLLRLGPFGNEEDSWLHYIWLRVVIWTVYLWSRHCFAYYCVPISRAFYKKQGVGITHLLVSGAGASLNALIGWLGAVLVSFTVQYFAQSEPTILNQAIELFIAGFVFPCCRIFFRFGLNRALIMAHGADDTDRLLVVNTISTNVAFGLVGAVSTSLMKSWTSYFLSMASTGLVEIASEYLTMRMCFRNCGKNPGQDKLNLQACRIATSDEADQFVSIISPIFAGSLMQIVMRSTNPEAVFVGWIALFLRIPLGLFFELATDFTKMRMVNKYFGVNPLSAKRQHALADLLWYFLNPFSIYCGILTGMCLAQH